jgi:flagellar hook-length control protein FliK
MELVATPSADLLALVDPAARGPAPLLGPAAGEPAAAAAEAPFAAFLALFGGPVPAGQLLPVTGKDLPLEPVDSGLEPDQALAPLTPLMPAALALTPALELGVRAGGVPAEVALPLPLPPAAPPVAASPVPTTLPGAELAAFAEAAPQAPPVVTPTITPPLDGTTPDQPDAMAATPSWLDELLADSAARPAPATRVGAEQRAAAAQAASAAPSALPPAAVVAPPPDATPQLVKVARNDGPRTAPVTALVGDTPLAARVDWLPPSSPHAAAPNAPTPPTVAPPSVPVDVRTPSWHEAFAGRVQWLVDNQVGEARIKLNPPDLGAIDVKISHVDEKSFVQLTAASPAARDELANGLHRLRELFSTSGLTLGGASVESGSAGYHDARAEVAAEPRAFERPATATFADAEAIPRARAPGRIDVFA